MKQKILIVEDDTAFATMLQKWFLRYGFDASICSKVAVAQTELKNKSYNLVLTDLRLPDGDGIMLLQWIKEQKMTIPVMVMTSYAEIQSAVAAIKFGAEDYLEKPIVPSILKEKIDQALAIDRKSVVLGKSVYLGGRRII